MHSKSIQNIKDDLEWVNGVLSVFSDANIKATEHKFHQKCLRFHLTSLLHDDPDFTSLLNNKAEQLFPEIRGNWSDTAMECVQPLYVRAGIRYYAKMTRNVTKLLPQSRVPFTTKTTLPHTLSLISSISIPKICT